MLSPEHIRRDGLFDPHKVTSLLNKFRCGNVTSTRDNMALVGILSTEILMERFVHQRERPRLASRQDYLAGDTADSPCYKAGAAASVAAISARERQI
jgi:hypothetical protein